MYFFFCVELMFIYSCISLRLSRDRNSLVSDFYEFKLVARENETKK